jgi:hypothetical protein
MTMHAHNPAVTAPRAALAVIALVALVGAGCSKKITSELIPNQRPEVRLTGAPVASDPSRPEFYAYTIQWVGYDPDGRVDHFLLAVDPARTDTILASDTTWHATAKSESTFFFSAGQNYDPIDPLNPKAQSPHVVSIFAVDDQGMRSSAPATRAFFSFTQCPSVRIEQPLPSRLFTPRVTPTVTFRWNGSDPDGQLTVKPIRWVFRLFGSKNPDRPDINDYISYAVSNPDSVRRYYAPDFPGFISVGSETTTFQYRNLNPGSTYLFIVTGFDEAGAYDPVFSPSKNMIKFAVTFVGSAGPVIRMFNQFFDYEYSSGGYDPTREFRVEVPADLPVKFNWTATPPLGANIRRYRWVMDLIDLTDQSPRSDETKDVTHWSQWSLTNTSASLAPFTINGEEHLFYIEAEDNNGLVSLGIIRFNVVRSTFEKSLLFVKDTRLRVDSRTSSTNSAIRPPVGTWPTTAELDTFLYARGGNPWHAYPPGTLSPPGILNGYTFDTLGTRGISADGTVPLSKLGQYKHIVWYVDQAAARGEAALRVGNAPGKPATLSTYMTQGYLTDGGMVWLCGGGAAYASLITWNKSGTPPNQYNNLEPNPELRPGRMMYDFAHWRVEILMNTAGSAQKFGTTTEGIDPNGFGKGTNRPGRHWPPNPPRPTPALPPNYALLPDALSPKTAATDPPPPYRMADANYLRTDYTAEYISQPTHTREDYDDNPDVLKEYATLDTLYLTVGGVAGQNHPVMTYYHGRENQPLVFSGFDFWYWQRSQCIQLVDWVLHEVWGLERDPAAPRAPGVPMAARQAFAPNAGALRAPPAPAATPQSKWARRAPR